MIWHSPNFSNRHRKTCFMSSVPNIRAEKYLITTSFMFLVFSDWVVAFRFTFIRGDFNVLRVEVRLSLPRMRGSSPEDSAVH